MFVNIQEGSSDYWETEKILLEQGLFLFGWDHQCDTGKECQRVNIDFNMPFENGKMEKRKLGDHAVLWDDI